MSHERAKAPFETILQGIVKSTAREKMAAMTVT
jgi:hypothetical protein